MARIRTVKPGYPKHPKVRKVSRDARLLNIHLWNFADDEGRLQELPNSLIGDIFPTDSDVTVAVLYEWLTELAEAGLIIRYEVNGENYIQCHDFADHQVINKAKPSDIPPADAESARYRTTTVQLPDGSRPEVEGEEEREEEGSPASAGSTPSRKPKRPDPDSLPNDFPSNLKPAVDQTLTVLQRIATAKNAKPVERLPAARAIASFPDRAHRIEAEELEQWWVHGKAANRSLRDVVAAYRKWLRNADPSPRPTQQPSVPDRSGYDAHAVKVVL